MVTTIVLLICFTLAFAAGGFVAFKGVQLGLRWQMETGQAQQPTMESPIKAIIEKVEEKQELNQQAEYRSIVDEWVNGEKESR